MFSPTWSIRSQLRAGGCKLSLASLAVLARAPNSAVGADGAAPAVHADASHADGAAALAAFSFTFVIFGAILIWTGFGLFKHWDEDPTPEE